MAHPTWGWVDPSRRNQAPRNDAQPDLDKRHSWDERSASRVLMGASQPTSWSACSLPQFDDGEISQRHRMLVAGIGTFLKVRFFTKSPVVSEQ